MHFYLINKQICHDFRVCLCLPPYLQEVCLLIDSKCWNTVIFTGWACILPWKVFRDIMTNSGVKT